MVNVKRLPCPVPSLSARIRPPCVRLYQPFANDEPKAAPSNRPLAAPCGSGVLAEEMGQHIGRDTPTLVGNRDFDVHALPHGRDPDR